MKEFDAFSPDSPPENESAFSVENESAFSVENESAFSVENESAFPLPDSHLAQTVREQLHLFLAPILLVLDRFLDKRLVRTLADTVQAILILRHRSHGLLLSELGAYLLSPDKAPAGTKRLSNLLRSAKWTGDLLSDFLWRQAKEQHQILQAEGQLPLLLWDESVLEKPESRKRPDLCPVRSAKAVRLARSRPGPPPRPTFVNGLQWVSLLLIGQKGPPTVAAMRWFTTRGERQTDARAVQMALLTKSVFAWGRRVLHVFDRGYAGTPWITACLDNQVRFLMRWPKRLKLVDTDERERAAWQILRGQPTWEERVLFDSVQNRFRVIGVLAMLVRHPEWEQPLWLLCARPKEGKAQEPWLLLTTEAVFDADTAFSLVLAYARRWQIEMAFRFGKSEMAMESPRVWTWERREKLLLLVTLVYAFLIALVSAKAFCQRLLRRFCHRTGKRYQEVRAPLYRLRCAVSRLLYDYPELRLPSELPWREIHQPVNQNSG